MEIAILGLGCFWSPEIKFSKLEGIIKTEVGYCGGHNAQTSYREVCSGTTNHAEVVKLDLKTPLAEKGKSIPTAALLLKSMGDICFAPKAIIYLSLIPLFDPY